MKYRLLFAILAVLGLSASGARAAEPELLKYEDFLQKLRENEVKSVTIGNWPFSQIEGIYAEGDREREFFSQRTLQAASDPLLLELLEKHQVPVVKKEHRPTAMELFVQNAPGLLLLVVPSALLVFVIIYMVKLNKKIDQVIIR